MSITGSDVLLYQKKDRIVIITLNRPEKLNALNRELMNELEEAWVRFRDDDEAWVAIVTGAGTKAFCAGIDLKEYGNRNQKGVSLQAKPPRFYPFQIWKPIIAAINGYAIAGGFALAHSCDVRIAAENAEFQIAETMWNIPAGWICDLSQQMNLGHALELVLWGDARITARRGYEIGWINKVVPQKKLMDEAMSWAERILRFNPFNVRNMKEILYRGVNMEPSKGLRFAQKLIDNFKANQDTV